MTEEGKKSSSFQETSNLVGLLGLSIASQATTICNRSTQLASSSFHTQGTTLPGHEIFGAISSHF